MKRAFVSRVVKTFFIAVLMLPLMGCPDASQKARDILATDYGWITTAQNENVESCQSNPAQPKCEAINRAIALHDTAIDALHLYCEGTPKPGKQAYDNGGPCSPNVSIEPRLKAAIRDLHTIVQDLKGWVR